MTRRPRVKVVCGSCGCYLGRVERGADGRVAVRMRCRWEKADAPDAPDERYTFWCPRPGCGRPRRLRADRLAANLRDAADQGAIVTL